MLRVELRTQFARVRTVLALVLLTAIPFVAGLSIASSAGHQNGTQGGLYGASPYSALNHAMASLAFTMPLLLPVVVSLLAAAIASGDRDWGVLRYLYVAPVTRTRLLVGKLEAVVVATTAALGVIVVGGIGVGLALFGWHPFHRIGASSLETGDAVGRALLASGYVLLCMLAMAAIAFTLGLWLPRGAEALAASIGLVVALSMLDAQRATHWLVVLFPVHYWQRWTALFEPGGTSGLGMGAAAQVVTVVLCTAISAVLLRRRDPAA